jgi:ubiquinone/menaquinone biosynthesis C-methylase UbiE/esterase/lipase
LTIGSTSTAITDFDEVTRKRVSKTKVSTMNISIDEIEQNQSRDVVGVSTNRKARFRTEALTISNYVGKKIVAYLDRPVDSQECHGIVIVAPAYGETKENNLLISAYFAANHYFGLRFDWTDHVGESEGDIFTSTLSKMRGDLNAVIDHVREKFGGCRIGIVATSLAARVALKLVATCSNLQFLICFTPVVNLQATLAMVYREDLVAESVKGRLYGTLNILGFSIDADHFLNDSIKELFSDISSARRDAEAVGTATFFVMGQRDAWVRTSDAQLVFEAINSKTKRILVLPAMLHRLLENPGSARHALTETVGFVANAGDRRRRSHDVIAEPDEDAVRAREMLEKDHLKEIYAYSKSDERRFWKEYLGNFQYIINIHDFYNLLQCVYDQLGGAWSGQKVLDAGCGIGNYGLFLLTKQLYRMQTDLQLLSRPPIRYFGIDFVRSAIAEAKIRINQLREQFCEKNSLPPSNHHLLESSFVLSDLDAGLPFPSDFFDQICCNLVLSYVQEPKLALKELWRVIRPGGKIVITSLKPSADLSEIYRNFISVAESPREFEEGRKLLSNAGMIKIKEIRGLYHFYTEKELKDLVRQAGFFRARTLRSFGDQANIVVCSKIHFKT